MVRLAMVVEVLSCDGVAMVAGFPMTTLEVLLGVPFGDQLVAVLQRLSPPTFVHDMVAALALGLGAKAAQAATMQALAKLARGKRLGFCFAAFWGNSGNVFFPTVETMRLPMILAPYVPNDNLCNTLAPENNSGEQGQV